MKDYMIVETTSPWNSSLVRMFRFLAVTCFVVAYQGCTTSVNVRDTGERIVGGEDALIEDYPWQVSVEIAGVHVCGGVIVHEYWTLTAASCTGGVLSKYRLRVNSSTTGTGGYVGVVEMKFAHERYDAESHDYDFGLFKVMTPFIFQSGFGPLSLPDQDQTPEDDLEAIATGWGETGVPGTSVTLQMVRLPIMSKANCELAYFNTTMITDRMICAGRWTGGVGACAGDGGGPLVLDSQVVGIASWGRLPCAQLGNPSVFSKVSSVRAWIAQHVPSTAPDQHVSFLLPLCASFPSLRFVYWFLLQAVSLL